MGTGFQESLTHTDEKKSSCSLTPQDHGAYTNSSWLECDLKERKCYALHFLHFFFTARYCTKRKQYRLVMVPEDWMKANVAPIFKKGECYNAENYRPISLTCIASKIMEQIVTKHIMKHLELNIILYKLHHGFRAKRSTETQLLAFV